MTGISQVKIASKKAENLRNFLVGHANINGGKTVLFFFKKSNKKGDTMGPPVKVSFRNMSVERENYQYGHSVHAKNLTASFCEKIIQFSKELELNIFFTVPALLKNKRKHDDVMGIGCAYLDDIPGTILSDSLFSDGMIIEDFSFPASSVIQTSPGNCQVLWNFKGFLPIDNKYKGPQPSFLPSAPKHRKDLFNRMLRLLKTKLEGDPGGSNLNQLYRLPFTLNHKYSPAPEVELLYSDFSPENRINFGKFYTELLMPEIKKHYKEKFPGIFSKIHKNNDWILIENLLGWGESAEDIGRSWTANERDMSATGRLLNHYKIPRDKIEKIITQSPNRQKGQSKGSKYFDSLFNKLDKKDIKNNKAITIRGRTTDDILRVFCEAGSLLFSRKPHVAVKLPTDDGSQTEVWRSGWVGGMTRQRAKVLIWALSEAKKKIIITFEAFMEKVIGMKISDYKDERSFRKTAYKTFDRLIRPLVALRFGVGKYYGLDLGSRAREEGVSPFKSFERTADGKVIIELSDEMNIALSDSERLKRISKDFLSFIEKAEQAVTPPLLLWIGENFYDKKNANAQVKLDSEELIKRLQGPRKITNTYAKYFRDEIYKSIKEINNKNLLKLVGTSARKIDVTSNREASEFVFEVSDFKGKNMIKR